jgi:hypothetical protein
MTINLNTNPYYDDFDGTKNYLKILFKPSYAVQARELTQLQTALQTQIARFGSHIFKDGSIVLEGKTSKTDVCWIDVSDPDASVLLNKTITGQDLGATGKVLYVRNIDTSTSRVYFIYDGGIYFQQNEQITTADSDEFFIVNTTDYTGTAKLFSIPDSVFFVKGYFVFCEEQKIILYEDSDVVNLKVGLQITESIVSSLTDNSLLDPANGSYNYAAPGADRYCITLTLTAYEFDVEDEAATVTGEFIELARYVQNQLVYDVTSASYSDLETTLARRTYDESGDYTVRHFGLKIKEHIFEDPDLLTLALEPGKAYVRGYEFETIATTNIDLEKARDFNTVSGRQIQADHGNYFFVETPAGASPPDLASNILIDIQDTAAGAGTKIGECRVRAIEKVAADKFKLFVYDVAMEATYGIPQIVSFKSGTWYANEWHSQQAPAETPVFYTAYRKSAIVPLPNSTVKTLLSGGVSDTSYQAYKTFQDVVISGSQVTIATGSADQVFLSTANNDFYLVNTTSGAEVPVTSVTAPSATQRTINITGSNVTVDIYTKVGVSNVLQRDKNLVTGQVLTVAKTSNLISLNKSDCYRINSIYAVDTAGVDPLPDLDITGFFDFDNGQRDEFYDHGTVQLKSSVVLADIVHADYDNFEINFDYFTATSLTGFFSVDSYTDLDYTDIPVYNSPTGEKYNLRDCLDFRPRRDDGATTITGIFPAITDSIVTVDYSYYLPRVDKLVLTQERKFYVVKGVPSENPAVPTDMEKAMPLYIIRVPAYTDKATDVTFTYIDNRRYTMRDIGKIEKRVERVEYYTALSLLEKQAKDETFLDDGGIERFKNGILVDSFAGHSVGDVNNPDYSCAIDPENRILRPRFAPFSFGYTSLTPTNIIQKGDLVYLPYTEAVCLEQPWATFWVNLNPYLIFKWNGEMQLNPATDTWVETYQKPDVVINVNGENDVYTTLVDNVNNPASVGVRWNDWQTVNRGTVVTDDLNTNVTVSNVTVDGRILQTTTTAVTNNQTTTVNETLNRTGVEISTSATSIVSRDMGTRVVDTSVIPFIRSRFVAFSSRNMKPNTPLCALFDGLNVTEYCTPAVEITTAVLSRDAKKVKTVGSVTKEARILSFRGDRIFVVMDPNSEQFEAGETLQWFVNGNWIAGDAIPTSGVNQPSRIETNAYGDCVGLFHIPNSDVLRFRTGERVFRLADSPGRAPSTAAETKYIASGMSQSTERTIIATRVATISIKPVTETDVKSSSSTQNIVVSSNSVTADVTPPPPVPPSPPLLTCGASEKGAGRTGRFTYTIDLGSNTGLAGIEYPNANVNAVPTKYTLVWNGQEYTTGFVGNAIFNERLVSLGFPRVVGDGSGDLVFQKTAALPNTATLIVDSPLGGSTWAFDVVCPDTAPVSIPYSISITGPTTSQVQEGVNPVNVTLNIRLNGGTSASHYGKVELSQLTAKTGFTFSYPGGGSYVAIRNGQSALVTGTLNRTTAGLTRFASWSTTIVASVTEYTDINLGTATGKTATQQFNWTNSVRAIETDWDDEDPVAQTFFINAKDYPNGVFVSKLDLFFRKKSATRPVQVQLRPVVNGYPSSTTILPFGVSTKEPNEVFTSTTGTVPTSFEFENLVHLAPGEYAFVAIATNDEYEIFTARLGEFSLSNTTQRVVDQPSTGSMFKSQNASTWTAIQMEDVKFVLHKAVFDPAVTGDVILNTDIATDHGNVPFDVFYTMGEVVDFAATNLSYSYKTTGDAGFIPYQLGSNVTMPATRVLDSSDPATVQFKVALATSDKHVTPVVDLNRLSSTLIKNFVNNDATDETNSFGGNAYARYITRRVNLNPGFESRDLKVQFLCSRPSDTSFKVYYKVSPISDSYFDDNEYIEMVQEFVGTYSETGFTEYKYKTPYVDVDGNSIALETEEKFNTFALKIVMLSSNETKVPQFKDLRVIALDD